MPRSHYSVDDLLERRIKFNATNSILGGAKFTEVKGKGSRIQAEQSPAKRAERGPTLRSPSLRLAAYRARIEAEYRIKERAKRDARKAIDAEEAKDAEEAEKQKLYDEKKQQEKYDQHCIDKERRKAAERARRENFAFTTVQTKKILSMVKEGKSWVEIAQELGDNVTPGDAKRHHAFINEITVVVKLSDTDGGNRTANGIENGNGKSKGLTDEEKVEAGKIAEAHLQANAEARQKERFKEMTDEVKVEARKMAEVNIKAKVDAQKNGKSNELTDEEKVEAGKDAEASLRAKADAQKNGKVKEMTDEEMVEAGKKAEARLKAKADARQNGEAKEMTDEEKVEAGRKAEANLKAKSDAQDTIDDGVKNRNGDKSGSGVTFIMKQCKKILGMRKAGKTWAEIARAIGHGTTSHDVAQQWKYLHGDASDDDPAPGATSPDRAGFDWNIFGSETIAQKASPDKCKNENGGAKNTENKSHGDQGTGTAAGPGAEDPFVAAMDEAGSAHKLRPDVEFSPHDCDILEMLLRRHQEQRWPRIQSGFEDCTGRMLPIRVLQAKAREML